MPEADSNISQTRPSQQRVQELLSYDPETGEFRRKWRADVRPCQNSRRAGKIAGKVTISGYISIFIDNKLYQAHRLAWLIQTGSWPKNEIDHKNGIGIDNRWVNLREATHAENCRNVKIPKDNKSGFKGVTWDAEKKSWLAQIGFRGRNRYLGRFDSAELAHAAYDRAATELFGEFKRGG